MLANYTWLIPAWLIVAPTVLIVMLLNSTITRAPPKYARDPRSDRDRRVDGAPPVV